ncbi:ParA family protein [Aliarcobacter butzleri]|uniref:ParA family protein n=1 Tax=Aliarcobacter butzleri TaxID=28197 RepID=UPI00263CE520|nr:ParA family protein [Aliarcobacter butzleri]MDN5061338.1 ParA family protein [Aliarcobacter butzleri]
MIITVAFSKGGVGKSTLTWNLANALRSKNKKVKIVDLDFQQTCFFLNLLADNRFEVLQPATVSELKSILKEKQDDEYIIIDTGGFDIDINRTAIENANKVLVPLSESPMDIIGFETFKAILKESKVHIDVVLNNIFHSQKDFSAITSILDFSYMKLLKIVVRQRKVYKTVLVNGGSVFESNNINAKSEIKSVLDELLGIEE